MGFFNNFPYTNFHDLNLDWILETVSEAVKQWESTRKEWEETRNGYVELENFVRNYFAELDLTEEVSEKLDKMYQEGILEQLISEYRNAVTLEMFGAKGDGESDDSEALLNACSSGSKILLFGKTYFIGQQLAIENCNMEGTKGSTIKLGGSIGLANCELSGITFDENGNTIACGDNVVITRCNFHSATIGIQAMPEGMHDCIISKSTFYDNAICDIYTAFETENVIIENCTLESNGSSHNIRIRYGTNCKIVNNSVANSGGGFGIVLADSSFCIISGNIISDTKLEGINLNNSSNVTVSENKCGWSDDKGSDFGISVYGESASCNFNNIIGNTIGNCAKAAINLERACSFNIVSGNIIQNPCRIHDGTRASETCVFIYSEDVEGGCNRIVVENNTFYYDRSNITSTVYDDGYSYQNIVRNNTAPSFVAQLSGEGDVEQNNNFMASG